MSLVTCYRWTYIWLWIVDYRTWYLLVAPNSVEVSLLVCIGSLHIPIPHRRESIDIPRAHSWIISPVVLACSVCGLLFDVCIFTISVYHMWDMASKLQGFNAKAQPLLVLLLQQSMCSASYFSIVCFIPAIRFLAFGVNFLNMPFILKLNPFPVRLSLSLSQSAGGTRLIRRGSSFIWQSETTCSQCQ